MNRYEFLKNPPRNQTLILVEGNFEKNTMLRVLCKCFPNSPIQMSNIHIYGTDIYDLYHLIELEYGEKWFTDSLAIDIPLLISKRLNIHPQLKRQDFTNIILIFDYEHHDNWYSDEKIQRLQKHFVNPTDDGILYINYPMIESFLHMPSIPDSSYMTRSVSVTCNPGSKYKEIVYQDSVLLKYLRIYTKILKEIVDNLDELDDSKADDIVFDLLSFSNKEQLQDDIYDYLKNLKVDEQRRNFLKHSISTKMLSLNYWNEHISYWEKLRKLIVYVIQQNICKAWSIQSSNEEEIASIKDIYEKLNWTKILEVQNMASADPVSGIIWVLCTCITLLGEYKFFWNMIKTD